MKFAEKGAGVGRQTKKRGESNPRPLSVCFLME